MKIETASAKATKYACLKYHYAESVPSCTHSYAVFNDAGEWCGCIVYGSGAAQNIASEFGLKQGEVLELVRVALNGKQEHTSQCVAETLKRLKHDAPLCRLVVSYADIDQSHIGTIYQATNWLYIGQRNENTCSGFIVNGMKTHRRSIYTTMIIENGERKHCPQSLDAVRKYIDPNATQYITKGKRKYIMPMDKRTRKQMLPLSQPYPKTDCNWQKIDRNIYKQQ